MLFVTVIVHTVAYNYVKRVDMQVKINQKVLKLKQNSK